MPDQYTSQMAMYVLSSKDKYARENISDMNKMTELFYGITFNQQLCNDVVQLIYSNRIQNAVMEDLGVQSLSDYRIDIESSEKTRVVTIKVTSKDPVKSTETVQALTNRTVELARSVTDADDINVIDEPEVPKAPSGPHRVLILIISVIAGLIVAAIIVFVRDLMDDSIKDRDELLKEFEYPVLAQFPKC